MHARGPVHFHYMNAPYVLKQVRIGSRQDLNPQQLLSVNKFEQFVRKVDKGKERKKGK